MAVFAHDHDINYANVINNEQSNKIIKLFDGCKSVKHVEYLRQMHPKQVPKIIKACRYFDHVNGARSRQNFTRNLNLPASNREISILKQSLEKTGYSIADVIFFDQEFYDDDGQE